MEGHVSEVELLQSGPGYDGYDDIMLARRHLIRSRAGDAVIGSDQDAGSYFVHGGP